MTAVDELPYREIPPPPERLDGVSVLARLVDGLGFRYRWATEGLRAPDLAFRPSAGSMSIGEVLQHALGLVVWVEGSLRRSPKHEPEGLMDTVPVASEEGLEALRRETLETLVRLRALLLEKGDAALAEVTIIGTPAKGPQPFWSAINGPLADFLTHVGQIASWRRTAGNPAPAADVFRGLPPRDVGQR